MARKAELAPLPESDEDLYVPVGIEEVPREGAPPKAPKPKAGPRTSAGAADFEFVKDGARHTLEGLRNFEWAGLFATLSNDFAVPAILILALLAAVPLGDARGGVSLLGWVFGVAALGLFLAAVVFMALGAWASHLGKDELGVLQRREVEKAQVHLWRGVYALIPGAGIALVLGFQESAGDVKEAAIPGATLLALAAGFGGALIASRYFALFLTEYLRNLAPKTGKRSLRRLRLLALLAGSISVAIALAGTPLLILDYQESCAYFSQCPQDELWTIIAPSFGPPSHVTPHLLDDVFGRGAQPGASAEVLGSLAVAGLLAFARLCAFFALRAYRRQVREAEIFVRDKVRSHAPEALPPG